MPARAAYEVYKVVRGDTLAAIAKRFGTTVAAITVTNGIVDANKIKVGQTLSIPLASGYDPDDVDLAEVRVTAKAVPMQDSSPKMDPRAGMDARVIGMVDTIADLFKPPKLYFTLAILAGLGYIVFVDERKHRS
jgi:murein DD-endopeptidase MepM/ murein hydrolase activator NlpD